MSTRRRSWEVDRDHSAEPRPPGLRLACRVSGSFIIGTVLARAVWSSAGGAVFGGFGGVGPPVAWLGLGVLLLALVHRLTTPPEARPPAGTSVRWATGVLLAAVLVTLAAATAWQFAGQDFGRVRLGWWLSAGASLAIVAAAASRRLTRNRR